MRDVCGPVESPGRKVRPAVVELSGAKPLKRVDELFVESVFDHLEDLDRRGEVLDGRIVLLIGVLHDREVVQCLCCLVRLGSVYFDRHLDDALRRNVCLVVILFFEQLPEALEFAQHIVFGKRC
jgi:hypothetical protein